MDYSVKEDILEVLYKQLKFLFLPSESNNYCPKFLQGRFLIYCVFCLVVLKIISIGFYASLPSEFFYANITKTALNNLINQNSEALGIQPLAENEKLDKIALLRAEDMIKKEYFSHQSPEGKSPWDWFLEAGYNYKYAGENLAIGFSNSEEVYYAWIDSPSHKENILNPKYKEMGTAVLGGFGKNKAILVVQLFGSPLRGEASKTMSANNINKEFTVNTLDAPKESTTALDMEAENKKILFQIGKNSKGGFYYAFLNFIIYDYETFLKNAVYGFLAVIIIALFIWMFYGFNIQYKNILYQHKNILFRSIIFIVLLSSMAFIDKNLIFAIIYRQMIS